MKKKISKSFSWDWLVLAGSGSGFSGACFADVAKTAIGLSRQHGRNTLKIFRKWLKLEEPKRASKDWEKITPCLSIKDKITNDFNIIIIGIKLAYSHKDTFLSEE